MVGHSRCGGIRALMTMDDDETEEGIDSRFYPNFQYFLIILTMHIHIITCIDSFPRSFIKNWVIIGKPARSISKSAASELSFDQQCQHCEKVG